MVVIGAYLKRRNNLIFISERSSMISEKELYLAFLELTDNLELYGVTCGLNIRLNKPVPAVMNGDFVTAVCDDDGEWQIVYRREAKRCKA